MFEVEKFVEYKWMNMMAAEAVQNFVDFAMGIMTIRENVNVDFVGEKMIKHDGKGEVCEFYTLACGIFKLFVMLILFSMSRLLDTEIGAHFDVYTQQIERNV